MNGDTNAPVISLADGGTLDLLYPDPKVINIRVIAEGLSKEARYNGQTPGVFYSVAQHSVMVCDLMPPEWAIFGLLHDAHEALGLKDLPNPTKAALRRLGQFPAYDALMANIDKAVSTAFGLPFPWSPDIKAAIEDADRRAYATERRDLFPRDFPWSDRAPDLKPVRTTIRPWAWAKAEAVFIERFRNLPVFPVQGGG